MNNDTGMLQAQERIETRDRLKAFMDTPDFKEFIVDGFQNDEVVRCSQALIQDAMQDEIDQRLLNQKVVAGAHLGQYLLTVIQMGNTAELQIRDAKEEEVNAQLAEDANTYTDPITGDECVVED